MESCSLKVLLKVPEVTHMGALAESYVPVCATQNLVNK